VRAWVQNCILTSQLLDSVTISLECTTIIHDLFSLHVSLGLPIESILLLLLFFPLFISDPRHDPLISLSLLLSILLVLLLLVAELLLNSLVPLLQ
jgi:hypothetical protein